jgi:hypothetical protein
MAMKRPRTVPVEKIDYDPVVDMNKGVASEISIVRYSGEGFFPRSAEEATLVGYCKESPLEVLEAVFPSYHVTRLNGNELFGIGDSKKSTPLLGIGIGAVEVAKTYDGVLEEILELKKVRKVKREEDVSKKVVKRIISRFSEEDRYAMLDTSYDQLKFNNEQVVDVLKGFL